jgi:hypothetical protein
MACINLRTELWPNASLAPGSVELEVSHEHSPMLIDAMNAKPLAYGFRYILDMRMEMAGLVCFQKKRSTTMIVSSILFRFF